MSNNIKMQPGCLVEHKSTRRKGLIIERDKFANILVRFLGERDDSFVLDMAIISWGYTACYYWTAAAVRERIDDRWGNRPAIGLVWTQPAKLNLI